MSTICKLPGPLRKPAFCTHETLKVLQLLITAGIGNKLVTPFAAVYLIHFRETDFTYNRISRYGRPTHQEEQPHTTLQMSLHGIYLNKTNRIMLLNSSAYQDCLSQADARRSIATLTLLCKCRFLPFVSVY